MEPFFLQCNFQKCRKILKETAWVTVCSRSFENSVCLKFSLKKTNVDVFCDEDGSREFAKASVCPACKTDLPEENGFVKQNLNPSNSIKPMMLAGLSPELIFEVSRKGLLFWTYQTQQQLQYQQNVIEWHKENYKRMEDVCKNEMINVQNHAESTRLNYINQVKKLTEKLTEQENQIQNIKTSCENLWGNPLNARSSQDVDNSTLKRKASYINETHDIAFNSTIPEFHLLMESRSPSKQEKRKNSDEETMKSGQNFYFQPFIPSAIVHPQVTPDEVEFKLNF